VHTNLGSTLMNGSGHAILARIDRNDLVNTINRSDNGVVAANLITLHGKGTKLEGVAGVHEGNKLRRSDASHLFSLSLFLIPEYQKLQII